MCCIAHYDEQYSTVWYGTIPGRYGTILVLHRIALLGGPTPLLTNARPRRCLLRNPEATQASRSTEFISLALETQKGNPVERVEAGVEVEPEGVRAMQAVRLYGAEQ